MKKFRAIALSVSLLAALVWGFAFVGVSSVVTGCSSTGKPSPLVAKIAVQYGVMKIIEKNPAYGPRIVEIVKSVKLVASGNDAATVDLIVTLINNQIDWTKFSSPADVTLVKLLLETVYDYLRERVELGLLPADKLLLVSEVADWILAAAAPAT